MPGPSTWPFWTSLSLFLLFVGLLLHNWGVVLAAIVFTAGSLVGWHWEELHPRPEGH
jgi:hypothetical protein